MPTKLTDADIIRLRERAAKELADAAELNSVSPEIKARAEWKMPVAEVDAILDEVARARALLRRIEWEGTVPDPTIPYEYTAGCPACGATNRSGKGGDGEHTVGCELAALLYGAA